MEFPDLGKNCAMPTCNKLDFLAITCDACNGSFCNEHYLYSVHNCSDAYKKNYEVPTCPLCNIPIPLMRGMQPDMAVNAHIDNDCHVKQSEKIFSNKCSMKGCKAKEVMKILCGECTDNYCLKHRHPSDHNCEGKVAAQRRKALDAAIHRQNSDNANFVTSVQGNMSDDEALARALALSMQESTRNHITQEEINRQLITNLRGSRGRRINPERCLLS